MVNDFTIYFWPIGRAILEGHDPYAIIGNGYPPAACYIFTIFALFPQQLSEILWLIANLLIFRFMFSNKNNGIKSVIWLGYTPFLFTLIVGQIDFFLFSLSSFLESDKWYAPAAAAILTLKPQLALIVLPIFLIDWLLHNKKFFVRWLLYCLILQSFPLLFNPGLYYRWWLSIRSLTGTYYTVSPGIFSLSILGVPLLILIPLAIALIIVGFLLGKTGSIQANLLALPFGMWYNSVFLMGTVPWKWMIPASWIAFILAFIVKGAYPFAILPALAFFWSISEVLMQNNKGLIWFSRHT